MHDPLKIPAAGDRAAAIIEAINAWNDELPPADRRAKYLRMVALPFVFYRGAFWAKWPLSRTAKAC